jgi:branched-chain amino acid transport system substrate-binding protein
VDRALAFISGSLQKTNIAVLYDSNAFGSDGLKTIEGKIADYGLTIVAKESYQTDETEEGMDTHLTKIQGSNPEVLVVWGTNPGPAKIAVRMQAKGMTIPFVGSHGIANQKFLNDAGAAANGVYFPAGKVLLWQSALDANSAQGKVVKKFVEDFTAEYGSAPDTFAGHGWDAVLITTDALKKIGTDGMDDLATYRSKFRDQIEKTTNLAGIGGVFNYSTTNHDGMTPDDMLVVKVVGGKWTLAQ